MHQSDIYIRINFIDLSFFLIVSFFQYNDYIYPTKERL